MPEARRIRVRGVVQGVGFRPFVYQTAERLGLHGWVLNDEHGVTIHAEGSTEAIDGLLAALREHPPPAAQIDDTHTEPATPEAFEDFRIRQSTGGSAPTTRISPDLCVCDDCLRELRDPADPRAGYAFINCTNCGPRYSIIRGLPYDRPKTTMAEWPMCERCAREYADPGDRRYHAQPTACPDCGPTYRLIEGDHEIAARGAAIRRTAEMLGEGAILAIKGIGGYHLACDATNERAVAGLRERKFRKEKPFALMASSLGHARRLVDLTPAHEAVLSSTSRPIVLAPGLAELPGVAPGTGELGVMLPYTPLHHLLFDAGAPDPLVLTSANRSSEPIAYRDEDARDRLHGIADAFLVGERAIERRVDDSVVAVRRDRPFVVRRSRGYAPESVASLRTTRPILAVGADLKNTVALATGGEVFLSEHIGDLGDLESDRAHAEAIDGLLEMYAIDRRELVVAHDLHPEYVSTRAALGIDAGSRVAVQHHEAHIAAVLLEHGRLDERVVGIALDGTGYGHDGGIWGGEFLAGSVSGGFRRVAHLGPVRMPGGDGAARHPVQAASAYLTGHPPEAFEAEPFGFGPRFRQARSLVHRGTRCAVTTSAGRLFDAAAAVCGWTREVTFEGQAAIWLEQLAGRSSWAGAPGELTLDPARIISALAERRLGGEPPEDSARRFHSDLAASLAQRSRILLDEHGAVAVALSGGVWQNALLLSDFLSAVGAGVSVLLPARLPVNDGCIAAGQAAIAAEAR